MDDSDPASPSEQLSGPELERARELANVGAPDGGAEATEALGSPAFRPAGGGKPAALTLDMVKARAFLKSCMSPRTVTYGLGRKVPFHGAAPGRDFSLVDCSGFVRELIWRATAPGFDFKDGSVVEHDWVRKQGFERSEVAAAAAKDGAVRIAFLPPDAVPSRIGHVAIIVDGVTLESHGGTGPDARPWTGHGWQAHTFVYVLDPAGVETDGG